MKTLEFIFQDTQIQFLLGNDKNVMINATEMAKAFGKRTDHFMKSDHAKAYISMLKSTPNGGNFNVLEEYEVVDNRQRAGIYFHRLLALKFAAWLDVKFEVWIYSKIDDILFGNYQKHWDAHMRQEHAKLRMEELKQKLLTKPTTELVIAFFEQERLLKLAKSDKMNAIKSQYKMDFPEE